MSDISTPESESIELRQTTKTFDKSVDEKFEIAVKKNDAGALQNVLLDPNVQLSKDILNQALHFASGEGYDKIVLLLCESKKADINSKDKQGRSATYIAARTGRVECLRILIQLGANVNLASANKKWGLARSNVFSFSAQVPLDERGCMTPLHAAVRYNSPECVRLILEKNGDVHAKDELGMQPILHAGTWVKSGDKAEIRKYETVLCHLLHYGANANASYIDDSDDIPISMSPLQTAAGLGSTVAVKELLEKGAEPRWGEGVGSGRTALHEAAKGRHFRVLQLLLPNVKEENEEEQKRRKEEDKEWVNLKDVSGNTALHYAAISGSKPCITLLLEKGGNLGAQNKSGMAAFEAILIHTSDAMKFICEHLDSMVTCNSMPEKPEEFKVNFNFEFLAPNGKEKSAEVVNSLITARMVNADVCCKIIDRPLVKAFINLEFSSTIIILILLFLIYFIHVLTLSLSVYFLVSGNELVCLIFQVLHIGVAIFVLVHVGHRVIINWRYYLFRFEIIFNGVGALLSVIGLILLWCGNPYTWLTMNFISTACLFQWIGFMSLCGLLPFVGTRVLVFSDLFKNLWWTTVSLIFVMIGYSMFFYLQLHSTRDQFQNFFASLETTVIMSIQDHGRGDIYSEDHPRPSIFFRIMFFIFMFIGPMFVINLLLNLTMSDRDWMIGRGEIRRLFRKIEFLDFVEKVPFLSRLRRKNLSSEWRPYEFQKLSFRDKLHALVFPSFSNTLSGELKGDLISLASKNSKQKQPHDWNILFEKSFAPMPIAKLRKVHSSPI